MDQSTVHEYLNTSFIVVGNVNPTGNGFYSKAITRHSKLKQIIKEPTRGSNILDLVFTYASAMFESPHVLAPVGSSDHATVLVESKVKAPKQKKAIRNMLSSDRSKMKSYLIELLYSRFLFHCFSLSIVAYL